MIVCTNQWRSDYNFCWQVMLYLARGMHVGKEVEMQKNLKSLYRARNYSKLPQITETHVDPSVVLGSIPTR